MATNRREDNVAVAAESSSASSGIFACLGPPLTDKEKTAGELILADLYDVDAWDETFQLDRHCVRTHMDAVHYVSEVILGKRYFI